MNKKPVSVLFVVAAFALLVQLTSTVRAEFTFSEPVRFPVPINSDFWDLSPILSPNNLELYFTSERPLWGTFLSERDNPSEPFGSPVRRLPEAHASISMDGLSLYVNGDTTPTSTPAFTVRVTRTKRPTMSWPSTLCEMTSGPSSTLPGFSKSDE